MDEGLTTKRWLGVFLLAVAVPALAQFDHAHRAWDALLKKYVVVLQGGKASQTRYAGLLQERAALKAYLDGLSAVSEAEFDGWSKTQRIAFLINAYNAFTVEKVLTRYPNIRSIQDFGKVFGNPFKDRFFTLLGRKFTLDGIEHDTLRKPGAYDEVRVHYALNCASAGCPMLREEAYAAQKLERQLEEQAVRFLSDRARNLATGGKLEVSMIFSWYRVDWERGYQGHDGGTPPIRSREDYFSRYAQLLSDSAAERQLVAEGKAAVSHLEYDWMLNDAGK